MDYATNLRRLFLIGVLLIALPGCSRDVMVSTVLEETGGLRSGDKVFLDDQEVGFVDRIDESAQTPGFTIEIGLYPVYAELVQENAVAYVPPEGPAMLVLLNPSEAAASVAPGGRLKGLSPLELVIWQVSDAAGRASNLMEALALGIDSYFESEDWERNRGEIDEALSELAADSRATAERVAGELQALIDALRETAADAASDLSKEVTRIEDEIDRLDAEGHEDLANSLRGLLERIEAAPRRGPEEDP